jgi:hypothetical protein
MSGRIRTRCPRWLAVRGPQPLQPCRSWPSLCLCGRPRKLRSGVVLLSRRWRPGSIRKWQAQTSTYVRGRACSAPSARARTRQAGRQQRPAPNDSRHGCPPSERSSEIRPSIASPAIRLDSYRSQQAEDAADPEVTAEPSSASSTITPLGSEAYRLAYEPCPSPRRSMTRANLSS